MATARLSASSSPVPAYTFGSALRGGLTGAVAAALISLALYFVTSLLGVTYLAPQPPNNEVAPIPWAAFIIANLMPGIAATLLFWLLTRFLPRNGVQIFVALAAVFLLVSFFPLVTMPAAVPLLPRLLLGLMHIISGVVIVWSLINLGRAR